MFNGSHEGQRATSVPRRGACVIAAAALAVPAVVVAGSATIGVVEAASGDAIVPVAPARLLETRSGPEDKTVDGQQQGGGAIGAGSVLELPVAGRGNVPDDADAVLLNVTAVFPEAPGYLTVFPCGEARPDPASNVNYFPDGVYPNAVLAKVGAGGTVCIYTLAATDVIADVNGYVPDGGDLVPVAPARFAETRDGPADETFDHRFEGSGVLGAGATLQVTVAGRGDVPDDAEAALLNVTAVLPESAGYLTVWPCGEPRPDPASNVNYFPGGVYPNAVLTKIGTGGQVCVYSLAPTHVLVDVNGFVAPGANLTTASPIRMLETRSGPDETTFDGAARGAGLVGSGEVVEIPVAGRGPVPADARAVFMNLTAVFPDSPGYLTAYPCGTARPDPASNVNYFPAGVYPNAVLAELGGDGSVCVYTSAPTHVIADIVGWAGSSTGDPTGVTIADDPVQPFDRIALEGLDLGSDLDDFSIVMELGDGTEVDLPVFFDDAGPYVVAPLDPDHLGGVGTVRLHAAVGGLRSISVEVPILALAAAPGAWKAVVDSLLASVDDDLVGSGLNRSQLRAMSINEVRGDLVTAKMLLGFLDDGTSNDLGSLLTNPNLGLTASERAVFESIIAKLALVDAAAQVVADVPESYGAAERAVAAAPQEQPSVDATSPLRSRSTIEAVGTTCRTKDLEIDDPEQLVEHMKNGVDGIIRANGAERRVLDAIATVTSVGSKAPGAYGALIGAIGTAFSAIEMSEYIDSITLPTAFASITGKGSKSTFNEDFLSAGSVTEISVIATSTGGDVSKWVDTILTTLFSTLQGSLIGRGLQGEGLNSVVEHIMTQVAGVIGQTAFGAALQQLGPALDPFCAEEWDVDIMPSAFEAANYVDVSAGGSNLDVRPDFTYRPTALGNARVRVSVKSDVFSRRSVEGFFPVETKPIIVRASPADVTLADPNESFQVLVEVENADNPQVQITTPVDSFVASPGSKSFNYEASRYPHVIEVRSISNSGLRGANDAPPRVDTVGVSLEEIRLVPSNPQLEAGEEQQMVAYDSDDEPIAASDLTWSAEGGTITAGGLYTAGDDQGDFPITATLKVDPTKTATAIASIRGDVCLFGTWELQAQRYLDDVQSGSVLLLGYDHQSGFERVTFAPIDGPDQYYPSYTIGVDITTQAVYEDQTIISHVRGTETGEFDVVGTGDDELHYIIDESDIERQQTYITEYDTTTLPWASYSPISQVGSLFDYGFDCDGNELAMAPDGYHSNVTTYWTRTG